MLTRTGQVFTANLIIATVAVSVSAIFAQSERMIIISKHRVKACQIAALWLHNQRLSIRSCERSPGLSLIHI